MLFWAYVLLGTSKTLTCREQRHKATSRISSQIPHDRGQGLVPSLDRNSANPYGSAALASSADTSGPSDKRPVLAQHAEQGALLSTENILPMHGVLAWNPAHFQLERN